MWHCQHHFEKIQFLNGSHPNIWISCVFEFNLKKSKCFSVEYYPILTLKHLDFFNFFFFFLFLINRHLASFYCFFPCIVMRGAAVSEGSSRAACLAGCAFGMKCTIDAPTICTGHGVATGLVGWPVSSSWWRHWQGKSWSRFYKPRQVLQNVIFNRVIFLLNLSDDSLLQII